VDISRLFNGCVGHTTEAPSYYLNLLTPATRLEVDFESAYDTSMFVLTSDGSWYCDDDSGGNGNPRISLNDPGEGQYAIWIATYEPGYLRGGRLAITAYAPSPSAPAANESGSGNLPLNVSPLPSADQYGNYKAVWSGIDFVNLDAPGTQTYSQSLNAGNTYRWTFMWCGTDAANLEQILAPFSISFLINDVQVNPSLFLVHPWLSNCLAWSALVSGWQSGSSYTLDMRYYLSAPLPPQNNPGDVGNYTQRIVVYVQ
jgi:hypothetical protein